MKTKKILSKLLISVAISALLLALTSSFLAHASAVTTGSFGTVTVGGSNLYQNANNLVPIPSGWDTYETNPIAFTEISHLDYSVLYYGEPSIRIDPYVSGPNSARECDGGWVNGGYIRVSGGTHVVFTCWMKTSASAVSAYNSDPTDRYGKGARIGIDFYTSGNVIIAGALVNGVLEYPSETSLSGVPGSVGSHVPWNTAGWTMQTIDCYVPSGYGITYMIPWMQVVDSTDAGVGWFANSALYINP